MASRIRSCAKKDDKLLTVILNRERNTAMARYTAKRLKPKIFSSLYVDTRLGIRRRRQLWSKISHGSGRFHRYDEGYKGISDPLKLQYLRRTMSKRKSRANYSKFSAGSGEVGTGEEGWLFKEVDLVVNFDDSSIQVLFLLSSPSESLASEQQQQQWANEDFHSRIILRNSWRKAVPLRM